jgi:hypothetical protein
MKKYSLILYCVFLFLSITSYAQKNTSKEKNDAKLEDLLENLDEDLINSKLGGLLQQIQAQQQNVKYENKYTFNLHTKIKNTISQNGESETIVLDYYASEQASMIKPQELNKENDDLNIIVDNKNKCFITLDEKNKEAVIINTDGFSSMMKKYTDKNKTTDPISTNFTITKTGKTKIILGYYCQEYLIKPTDKNDSQQSTAWVTKDASIGSFNIMESMGKAMFEKSNAYKNKLDGAILEMHTKNTKTGEVSSMEILEINKKTTTKDLSKYKIENGFSFED